MSDERIDLNDDGELTVPGSLPLLDAAAAARSRRRYLPVDAAFAATTAAEAALDGQLGPRALGYGPRQRWVERATDGEGQPVASEALGRCSDPANLTAITWRTLPDPPAARTVLGHFRESTAAAGALARLAEDRPSGLVAAELCDRSAGRWLLGTRPDAARLLVLRVEGDPEPAARAGRASWQAVELAGGRPMVFERALGPWRWGPVHPPLDDVVAVRIEGVRDALPMLLDAVLETAELLGQAGVRAHGLLDVLHGYLPAGPQLDEALTWLRRRARDHRAQLTVLHDHRDRRDQRNRRPA